MKKMKKVLSLLVVMAMVLGVLTACSKKDGGNETKAPQGPVDLTLWGAEEDQALLGKMVESFKAAYPDVTFNIQIGVESESTAKDTVLVDVTAAADVYAFASDQLNELVAAGALLPLENVESALTSYAKKTVADIKSANLGGAVDAALADGKMYAFPMTADNGFFLFYDPAYVSAEDAASWDTLLAAAQKAGKQVGMTLASGWYNAGFFFGAGFETGLGENGVTTCNFNGKADFSGVDVVKGMLSIASHPAFLAIPDGQITGQIASGDLCAVVTGVWDTSAVEAAFTDGKYEACKLPTYTVAGQQVQQGSFAGFKLVGVNAYSKNAGWAALLAEWITNEQNQLLRFQERQLGPSNINVANSETVQANKALAAVAQQAAYAKVQLVGGKYWDPTATFGEMVAQGAISATDDAAIQEALDNLVAGVTAPVE